MTLATMKNPRKRNEIQTFLQNSTVSLEWNKPHGAVWLNGNDLAIKEIYFWNDDEVMGPSTVWYDGRPDRHYDKKCVSLMNFELYKQNCSLLNYYLCERK